MQGRAVGSILAQDRAPFIARPSRWSRDRDLTSSLEWFDRLSPASRDEGITGLPFPHSGEAGARFLAGASPLKQSTVNPPDGGFLARDAVALKIRYRRQ